MPYKPHLPPPVSEWEAALETRGAPPIPEKPVTPVTAVTKLLRMTLEEFEHAGWLAQVRVPWLPENLWFVSGERQVETLIRQGISRGRIWTARELRFIWAIPSIDTVKVEKLGGIKAQLGGDIVSVEGPGRAATNG